MAIASYSDLLAKIGDFLAPGDTLAEADTFVQLFEAEFNREFSLLAMQKRSTFVVSGGSSTATLPSDYKDMVLLESQQSYRKIAQLSLVDLAENYDNLTGEPCYYAFQSADTIRVSPVPQQDTTLEITYVGYLPALSDSNTTNWLLDSDPMAYLYGSLTHAAEYLQDTAAADRYALRWEAMKDDLRKRDLRQSISSKTQFKPAVRLP